MLRMKPLIAECKALFPGVRKYDTDRAMNVLSFVAMATAFHTLDVVKKSYTPVLEGSRLNTNVTQATYQALPELTGVSAIVGSRSNETWQLREGKLSDDMVERIRCSVYTAAHAADRISTKAVHNGYDPRTALERIIKNHLIAGHDAEDARSVLRTYKDVFPLA